MTDLLIVVVAVAIPLLGKKVAPSVIIVNTGTASTIATNAANIILAVHIASGGGSTHASPSGSNVIGALPFHRVEHHNAITTLCFDAACR